MSEDIYKGIYTPRYYDRDPDAEALMHMGKVDEDPNNALYDPWFESAEQAVTWQPEGEG